MSRFFDDLRQRVDALVRRDEGEAQAAAMRIGRQCDFVPGKGTFVHELNLLVRERERLNPGSPERERVQEKIHAFDLHGVHWNPAETPCVRLERRVREEFALLRTPGLPCEPNAKSAWETVVLFHLLTEPDLSRFDIPELQDTWEPSEYCRMGRRGIGEVIFSLPGVSTFFDRVGASMAIIQSRDEKSRVSDLMDTGEGLERLRIALSMLYADLSWHALRRPELTLKHDVRMHIAAVASDLVRRLADLWPAGACDPETIRARDETAISINISLMAMRSDRPTDVARAAAGLSEGIQLLDTFVRPQYQWPPVPLMIPPTSGTAGMGAHSA